VAYVRYNIDNMILNLPFVGKMTKKIEIARFSHFFSVMFSSGIDVLESLENAGKVIKNDVLKEAIQITKKSVSEGYSLHSSLEMTSQFPKLVIRMFQIGEDSGRIEESLKNITYFYDKEVNDAIDRLISAIQPTLTIFLGLMVGWVVLAIFTPIYGTFDDIAI
jgi:type IV pilus assembly protein PilC